MHMDLSDYRANADLQRDGVTIPFGSFATVTIRSANDERFVSFWSKIQKKYQREIDAGKLDEKIGRELLARAMAQRLILGWNNLLIPKKMADEDFELDELKYEDAKGDYDMPMVEIPWSKKQAYAILNHANYASFRGWMMRQASEISNFQDQELNDDLGNLLPMPPGKKSGESLKKS